MQESLKTCPICNFANIGNEDKCPQCEGDLSCFNTLDAMQEENILQLPDEFESVPNKVNDILKVLKTKKPQIVKSQSLMPAYFIFLFLIIVIVFLFLKVDKLETRLIEGNKQYQTDQKDIFAQIANIKDLNLKLDKNIEIKFLKKELENSNKLNLLVNNLKLEIEKKSTLSLNELSKLNKIIYQMKVDLGILKNKKEQPLPQVKIPLQVQPRNVELNRDLKDILNLLKDISDKQKEPNQLPKDRQNEIINLIDKLSVSINQNSNLTKETLTLLVKELLKK